MVPTIIIMVARVDKLWIESTKTKEVAHKVTPRIDMQYLQVRQAAFSKCKTARRIHLSLARTIRLSRRVHSNRRHHKKSPMKCQP